MSHTAIVTRKFRVGVHALVLVSTAREEFRQNVNIVKMIVKFIRKGVHFL
jgi:hypothetical protein